MSNHKSVKEIIEETNIYNIEANESFSSKSDSDLIAIYNSMTEISTISVLLSNLPYLLASLKMAQAYVGNYVKSKYEEKIKSAENN